MEISPHWAPARCLTQRWVITSDFCPGWRLVCDKVQREWKHEGEIILKVPFHSKLYLLKRFFVLLRATIVQYFWHQFSCRVSFFFLTKSIKITKNPTPPLAELVCWGIDSANLVGVWVLKRVVWVLDCFDLSFCSRLPSQLYWKA